MFEKKANIAQDNKHGKDKFTGWPCKPLEGRSTSHLLIFVVCSCVLLAIRMVRKFSMFYRKSSKVMIAICEWIIGRPEFLFPTQIQVHALHDSQRPTVFLLPSSTFRLSAEGGKETLVRDSVSACKTWKREKTSMIRTKFLVHLNLNPTIL